MSELLPCPFCGGNDLTMVSFGVGSLAYVRCERCGARGTSYGEPTMVRGIEGLAMDAWNRRAERTCHFRVVREHVPGRRFRGDICECDQCGYRCARGFIHDERFKHCPNCGARVLGGDAS